MYFFIYHSMCIHVGLACSDRCEVKARLSGHEVRIRYIGEVKERGMAGGSGTINRVGRDREDRDRLCRVGQD